MKDEEVLKHVQETSPLKGKWLISATSYSGKTTAHQKGLVIDPEELPSYAPWKAGWGDPKKAHDPGWRAQQKEAFNTMVDWVIEHADCPVTTHPGKVKGLVEAVDHRAMMNRWSLVILWPDFQRLADRAFTEIALNPTQAHLKARVSALLAGIAENRSMADKAGFAKRKEGFIMDHVRVTLYSSMRSAPTFQVAENSVTDCVQVLKAFKAG